MARLTPNEFDVLERAVMDGRRLAIVRRGTELVVKPIRIFLRQGREMLEAEHPSTGDRIQVLIDDLESVEVVR
jgi:hypothetical protein